MPENTRGSELIPMEEITLEPNTFIALDYVGGWDGPLEPPTRRIVGTVVSSTASEVVLLTPGDERLAEVIIPRQAIVAGWYAPMGYRP